MMKKIPKLSIALLILIAATANAQKATEYRFSLQQTVDFAKKNNVQVKNALLDVQIQQQINKGITAAALPSFSGNISTTAYEDIPVQVIPDFISPAVYGVLTNENVQNGSTGSTIKAPNKYGAIAAKFGTRNTAAGSLQFQQLLFDGQVFVGLKARGASIQFQNKAVEITEEAIKVNVHKIYYQLVVAKTQIELIDANIIRLQKLQHDVTEIYKNGFAEKLDVDKLEVSLNNLQTEKRKVLNSIEIGYFALKTLIGMPAKVTLILTDKITDTEIKSDALVDSANYDDRKEFQYLQIAKKLGEYNIKRYQLSYLPTVALTGVYAKQAQRNKFTFFEKGDWFATSYLGLNISIPIFSGFSKDAKVKQSKLELQQTVNSIDNLMLNIDAETEQAKLKFKSAIETIDVQKRNMQLAEKVYDQTKKKFESGTGSNTEITTAETELKTAQTNYVSALYDAIIAKVDYLKAIGKL
jgi:outer membrane protein TolC